MLVPVGVEPEFGVAVRGELDGGFGPDPGRGGFPIKQVSVAVGEVGDEVEGAGVPEAAVEDGRFDDDLGGLPVLGELEVRVDVALLGFGDGDFFAAGESLRELVNVGAAGGG